MLNQFAVEIPTLPVDQWYSLNILLLKDCWDILSYRRAAEKGRQAFETHGLSGNVFANHMHLHQHLILKNCINGIHQSKSHSIRPLWRKVKGKNKIKIWDASLDRQPKIQSSSVEERLFKGLWGRPTTTADFGSSFWQVPYASNLCLLEDKVQDRGMYLFTIPYGSFAMDQRSGDGWFSGWFKIFCHQYEVFQCLILK